LEHPSVIPPYSNGEGWVMDTWWSRMPPLTTETAAVQRKGGQ